MEQQPRLCGDAAASTPHPETPSVKHASSPPPDPRGILATLGPPLDHDNQLRPNWTEKMVREFASVTFAMHSMAMWDGFAPTRREFQLVIPSDRSYRRYFGNYTTFVTRCGYKIAMKRRTSDAMKRRKALWDAEKKAKAAQKLAAASAPKSAPKPPAIPPESSDSSAPANPAPKAKRSTEILYGDRLHNCGMAHAPVNEQGVVLLFGMLASKLGYEIEMVRTAYPDCEAKRKGKDGKLRRVLIEFEFATSRFDHDPEGCDLIVCWEDDNNHSGLEVLELKKVVMKAAETEKPKKSKAAAVR
ncbi:MAG: hypothetical protein ACREJD_04055 [Phycisphaerales bacterium]